MHVHTYEIHNTCCYMLISLFWVGIVFHLGNNGYDRLKVEKLFTNETRVRPRTECVIYGTLKRGVTWENLQ